MEMIKLFSSCFCRTLPTSFQRATSLAKAHVGGIPRAVEMAQRVRVLAAEPAELGSIPGTHR